LAAGVPCTRWEEDGKVHVTAQGAAGVLEPGSEADAAAWTHNNLSESLCNCNADFSFVSGMQHAGNFIVESLHVQLQGACHCV
jgi:hypothetical protein